MRTAALLPVKRFAQAKQRLGASVADPLRLSLARAMVADVLLALSQAAAVQRTIVVTSEKAVALAAREQGAIVLDDQAEGGQSVAVTLGVQRAIGEGFERVLCVPGDCPALDPAELDGLLRAQPAGSGSELVIMPDRVPHRTSRSEATDEVVGTHKVAGRPRPPCRRARAVRWPPVP